MGFNTAVIILNDHLSDIRDDPQFGRKLYDACLKVSEGERVYTNDFKVITTRHADDHTVIVMHGNTARVFSPYCEPESRRVSVEDAERLLNDLARMYGYKLVKKGGGGGR